jgi:hypothetical protein
MIRKAIPASFGGASGPLILGRFAGPKGFADRAIVRALRRFTSRPLAQTLAGGRFDNAADLRGEYDEAVADCLCLDTTLRSFNARAGLLTEL